MWRVSVLTWCVVLTFSTANRACKKGYRKCVNGRCITQYSWCNGHDDCGDNSDELFCNGECV